MTTLAEGSKLVFPSKENLIRVVRMMDPDDDVVVLNLNKCSFEASPQEVQQLDPLIKQVKHYKPGSFAVTIEGRANAIRFIEKHYGGSLRGRPFYLKMGLKLVDSKRKPVGQ